MKFLEDEIGENIPSPKFATATFPVIHIRADSYAKKSARLERELKNLDNFKRSRQVWSCGDVYACSCTVL